eukprot:336037-Rhodomonas_salina.1
MPSLLPLLTHSLTHFFRLALAHTLGRPASGVKEKASKRSSGRSAPPLAPYALDTPCAGAICLRVRACLAISGAVLAYGACYLRACYAVSGTDLVYDASCCYVMSGTEIAYGGPRRTSIVDDFGDFLEVLLGGAPRNPVQETAFSVHFEPGMQFLVFDFGV